MALQKPHGIEVELCQIVSTEIEWENLSNDCAPYEPSDGQYVFLVPVHAMDDFSPLSV